MKNYFLRTAIISALGLLLSAGHLFGASLNDTFPGTTLDTAKWTPDGYFGVISVNDGLFLSHPGYAWDASVRSVDGTFDYHASPVEVTIDIASFENPAINYSPPNGDWGAVSYQSYRLHIGVGPATYLGTGAGGMKNPDPNESGFGFLIRWRTLDRLEVLSDTIAGLGLVNLTAVPTSIVIELDATNYSITFVGSTIVETGGNVLTGAHGLPPTLPSYHLLIDSTQGNTANPLVTAISSISASTASAGPDAPKVAIAVAVGTDPEVSFPSESGYTYQLQKSTTDLSGGSWADVVGQSVVGDGNPQTLSDPAGNPASGQKAFYRVIVN